MPGFSGYYLIEAVNGIFSSLGLFETPEQGAESTKVVATWIRDENLMTLIPNEPKITSGRVIVHSNGFKRRVVRPRLIRNEGPAQPGPRSFSAS